MNQPKKDHYSFRELNRIAHTRNGYKKILKNYAQRTCSPKENWEEMYNKACYYAKALGLIKYIDATHYTVTSLLVDDEQYLMKTMEDVKGNTPIVAMNIIIKNFCEIFKLDISNNFWKSLLCKKWGKIIKDWDQLEKETHDIGLFLIRHHSNTRETAWYRFWYDISQWVHMMYIHPRHAGYDYKSKKIDRDVLHITRPSHGWDMCRCELCWRLVPVNLSAKKRTLCYVHKGLYSTDSLYRKQKRLSVEINPDTFREFSSFKSKVTPNLFFADYKQLMHHNTPYVNIWKFISQCQTTRKNGEELKGLLEEKTKEEKALSSAVIPDYYQQALDELYCNITEKYQCSFNEAFCKYLRGYLVGLPYIEIWLRLTFQDKRKK